jgi:hypothetical protein
MKRTSLAYLTNIVLLAGNVALAAGQTPANGVAAFPNALAQEFVKPPASARAWVSWFWLNGNISREGITADLEAMKRAGLGGALWMWGGELGADTSKPVRLLSPEWWDLMRHAIRGGRIVPSSPSTPPARPAVPSPSPSRPVRIWTSTPTLTSISGRWRTLSLTDLISTLTSATRS